MVDRYSEKTNLLPDKFENIKLDKYIGEDIEIFFKRHRIYHSKF